MSFWNFLGEFALFNMVCKWFSGQSKRQSQPYAPFHDYTHDAEYTTRMEELQKEIKHSKAKIAEYQRIIDSDIAHGIDDSDVDELQERIDKLEEQLDNCDVMSNRYYRIQDEIDRLQDRLDDIEDRQDMYDDWLQCELDDLYDNLEDAEIDRDDDW
ncbi:MAG: hypothetical protein K2F77_02985 [Muribaculaceae bacterium]|nr:hypothetical protein [Muribaculaceae bacterium]